MFCQIRPNEMLSPVIMQWERQQAMCMPPTYIFTFTRLRLYILLECTKSCVYKYVEGGAQEGAHINTRICMHYIIIFCYAQDTIHTTTPIILYELFAAYMGYMRL